MSTDLDPLIMGYRRKTGNIGWYLLPDNLEALEAATPGTTVTNEFIYRYCDFLFECEVHGWSSTIYGPCPAMDRANAAWAAMHARLTDLEWTPARIYGTRQECQRIAKELARDLDEGCGAGAYSPDGFAI